MNQDQLIKQYQTIKKDAKHFVSAYKVKRGWYCKLEVTFMVKSKDLLKQMQDNKLKPLKETNKFFAGDRFYFSD